MFFIKTVNDDTTAITSTDKPAVKDDAVSVGDKSVAEVSSADGKDHSDGDSEDEEGKFILFLFSIFFFFILLPSIY